MFTRSGSGRRGWALIAVALGAIAPAVAGAFERTEDRQSCASHSSLRNPYFGDLHVHTKYSFDAAMVAVVTGPRNAYRFAQGEEIGLPPFDSDGAPLRYARLRRPLDFAAVTDHAEFFGEVDICLNRPDLPGYNSVLCKLSRDDRTRFSDPATPPRPGNLPFSFIGTLGALLAQTPVRNTLVCGPNPAACLDRASVVWQDTQAAAEEFYDRSRECRFTNFVAYEWTANPQGANLHRNVIFRNEVVPPLPITAFEAAKVQQLWDGLVSECREGSDRCDMLTIAHNSNLSLGLMFNPVNADGSPLTAADAEFRAAMEPLAEITQTKGSSECRPGVLTSDEQCDFESMDRAAIVAPLSPDATFAPNSFVRNALKEGLVQEEQIGANPFKLGLIGSTDTHNSTPGATSEADYAATGHGGAFDSTPELMLTPFGPIGIETNSGGLAVVWAEENSRDALFEAMRRREVYATSGTRPVVRFFGGWKLNHGLCHAKNAVKKAYATGVPMGGDLPLEPDHHGPDRAGPRFLVSALQDPGDPGEPGTPLQRIQIVKGWVDESGAAQEQVFDVAGSAENGAGVDLATCEPTGTGFASLCQVWEDPDFDPAQRSFYYARVLENPTCRWSTRLCNDLGVDCSQPESVPPVYAECCSARVNKTVQERAWTSPIWYRP